MNDQPPAPVLQRHVLSATGVRVDARPVPLLEPTSLTVRSGERLLVAGEPGHGHTALALALGGRLKVDAGAVELDGSRSARLLRRSVALVDVPGVSEPDAVLPLGTVVAEELAMAGLPTRHGAVHAFLAARGLEEMAEFPLEAVPPAARVRVLTELAAQRREVVVLVITVPDRFGGDPRAWWALAGELAAAGFAVVVTCSDASALVVTAAPTSHPWTDPTPVALGSARNPAHPKVEESLP